MTFCVFIQAIEQQRVTWKVQHKIPHGDQHFAPGPRLSSRDKLVHGVDSGLDAIFT